MSLDKIKKRLLISTLSIMPKSTKNKALVKVLNRVGHFVQPELQGQQVAIAIPDIKMAAQLLVRDGNVELAEDSEGHRHAPESVPTFELSFDQLCQVGRKRDLLQLAEQHRQQSSLVLALVNAIDDKALDQTLTQIYQKLSAPNLRPPRFDLDSASLNDLETAADIDFVRDSAVKMEQSNLKKAHQLMALAHQARPQGQFIKDKLDLYRQQLGLRHDNA
ncbi:MULTISPECIES: hypothetical protein [unclassified Vibrio]|uniref:Uncharacterized protein n=1 Tax=Vibrio sp. HB236076 TaxID=3232307 RepID=A0AB39HF87_9VIBR|nr:hypothetical protein [Vibrio sp. HB161653]MDP5255382.1 hypothetical protein [Vibrio sp. HB161653]